MHCVHVLVHWFGYFLDLSLVDCIVEALGNPQKEKLKHEDTNISNWLQGTSVHSSTTTMRCVYVHYILYECTHAYMYVWDCHRKGLGGSVPWTHTCTCRNVGFSGYLTAILDTFVMYITHNMDIRISFQDWPVFVAMSSRNIPSISPAFFST